MMKQITSCLALLLAGTSSGGTAVLSFGEPVHDPTGWTVDVHWISDSPTLAGFQFEISIPELLEAGGGWCADNDWTLEHTQEMVLGFAWSFDAMVPPGTGVTLCTLQLGEEASGSSLGFKNVVCSDETATAIEVDATHTVLLDACPGDLDGNGSVGVDDLLSVIAAWNSEDETGDADGDGYVDVSDLLVVISGWGTC
ncbi:MAG: hypothetical protein VX908_03435 [Planctomycetota bacterium]|nr:hypothetical protein [Planctomycetota bacterium]